MTVVVFPFLKISRKKPEQTAQEIGEYLKAQVPDVVADFNVIKGFLNIVVSPSSWIGLLNDINADERFGFVAPTEFSFGDD